MSCQTSENYFANRRNFNVSSQGQPAPCAPFSFSYSGANSSAQTTAQLQIISAAHGNGGTNMLKKRSFCSGTIQKAQKTIEKSCKSRWGSRGREFKSRHSDQKSNDFGQYLVEIVTFSLSLLLF